MTEPTVRINEKFGPTIQGEGPRTGQQALFIRLYGCNLDCTWCDTPETWDTTGKNGQPYIATENQHTVTVSSLTKWANQHPNMLVVITGGEPLLQATPLTQLAHQLHNTGHPVQIETNGTRPPLPTDTPVEYSVSPKLANSGTTPNHKHLNKYVELNAVYKIVAQTPEDINEIQQLATTHNLPANKIWVMPEGIDTQTNNQHLQQIAQPALNAGYNITTRLHTIIWGNKKGH